MTHEEAHKILDAVRNGVPHPAAYISKALHLTGDLGAHALLRSKGVDQEIPSKNRRGWGHGYQVMVGRSKA